MKSSIIRYSTFSILILLAISCTRSPKKRQSFSVGHMGALKNIMHKGDISAQADLLDFSEIENFYALGALENLKGEIQIFNSRPYHSFVQEGKLAFDSTYSKRATLFVYSTVEEWITLNIPNTVTTEKDLEGFLEKSAKDNNIDTDQAFPFLIEGEAKEISWHVIDWKEGDTEHSHEKHVTSGLYGKIGNIEVELLGFYSNSHHAIFTHHTTNLHIHMKLGNGEIAGHVDDLKLGDQMLLKLPNNN